jgi:hypothetical protein
MSFRTLVPALCLAAAVGAHAEPQLGSEHGINPCQRTMHFGYHGVVGHVVDIFFPFTLTGPRHVLSAASVVEGAQPFQFRNGMLTLWRDNGNRSHLDDELLGGFDFGSPGTALAFPALPAGRYFWRLEGIADGSGDVIASAVFPDSVHCPRR